jgi:hypothetical protein
MQQRDGKPDARALAGDLAQMRSRLGMAGSRAGREARGCFCANCPGRHPVHVFTYERKPVRQVSCHRWPLGPYIELFAQQLREQRFSPASARAQILQALKLSRWLRTGSIWVGAYSATPTAGDGHYRLCATPRSGFLPETHQAHAHRLALIPAPLAASW